MVDFRKTLTAFSNIVVRVSVGSFFFVSLRLLSMLTLLAVTAGGHVMHYQGFEVLCTCRIHWVLCLPFADHMLQKLQFLLIEVSWVTW